MFFLKLKNYIPSTVSKDVFSIDYEKLFVAGKRLLIIDIDNTLIPYDVSSPNEEIKSLHNFLITMGFKIIFMSNNKRPRVEAFSRELNSEFYALAKKPFSFAYNKIFKKYPQYQKEEIHVIGDQLMTDILGANKVGLSSTLVKVIKPKTEKWYTKLNRYFERKVLSKMKKKKLAIYYEIISLWE